MNITIDKTVTYEVSKVVISNITINRNGTSLYFMIPFGWTDTDGNVLNRSMKRYTDSQLVQLATSLNLDFTPFITMVNNILSGDSISLRLDLSNEVSIKGTVIRKINDKYSHVVLQGNDFNTAISPFTQQDILEIVTLISQQLT